MTASVSAPSPSATSGRGRPAPRRPASPDFELVESMDGWMLTMTLTDRLRDALASGGDVDQMTFAVRIAPNLVPGEPFEARLRIADPSA